MIPLLQILHDSRHVHGVPMESFYTLAGISRQGYFKAVKRLEKQSVLENEMIAGIADYRMKVDARAGCRSLFYNLSIKSRFNIGVNQFERIVSSNGLSLRPLRVKVVTSRSTYQSRNYVNLINGMKVSTINQVVVGDLTYLQFNGIRYFLFSLIDVYSAYIVGWCLGRNMKAIHALHALNQWYKLRGIANLAGCIHHTDGGGQYFSQKYIKRLKEASIQSSRAGTCLENGYAEQRNGLVKNHLIPLINPDDGSIENQLKRLIMSYNTIRKQKALGWRSPLEFERDQEVTVTPRVQTLYKFTTD